MNEGATGGQAVETDPAAQASLAAADTQAYSPNAIHLLRTVQNNTLHLAQMADQKASILLGASFVVFSIAIGRGPRTELPWALTVLAVFAFLSALCGAIAVMPSVGRPRPSGRLNSLFFGHFYARDEDEWAKDLLAGLHSDESVFRLMLRDIYQNGQVLGRRKYRYLGYAYRLFITGLIATLATALVELTR
ncbi:MAG: Pycsar system effector family protein [Croceibacterium sp.]